LSSHRVSIGYLSLARVDGVGVDASIPTRICLLRLISRGWRSAARRPAALKICHQALFCKL